MRVIRRIKIGDYYGVRKIKPQNKRDIKSTRYKQKSGLQRFDIPRSNFNRYCRNEFQRIDAVLICKLCWYFGIGIDEIIEYIPPEK